MDLKQFQQLASGVSSLVTALAVVGAAYKYWQSKKLERARWMVQLYEKFYEELRFKRIRNILDCRKKGTYNVEIRIFAKGENVEVRLEPGRHWSPSSPRPRYGRA